MKTFEQWWKSKAGDVRKDVEDFRKANHDLRNELTAANLRAQVAERKLKDAFGDIDWLSSNWGTLHLDYKGSRKKCDEIRQRHKLDEVKA